MIRRQLHHLRYFCSDAWDEWRHSKAVNFLALTTLAAALFLAGLIMLIVSNIEQRVQGLRNDMRVEIYLADDLTAENRATLTEEVESAEGVERVVYVDPDEALRRYRVWAGELAELINELDSNPLPASLEVFLRPGTSSVETAARLAAGLKDRVGVEEVRYNQEWLHRLESLLDLARVGGSGLALLVFGAVIFVVASVLRLAVYARRDEIEIMRLVGATPGFIRGPFLVAGATQGLVASILALLTVEGVRAAAVTYASSGSAVLLELVGARPLAAKLALSLVLIGLLVSLAGSYFSTRQQPG